MTDTERLDYISNRARHGVSVETGERETIIDMPLLSKSFPAGSSDILRASIDAAMQAETVAELAAAWVAFRELGWKIDRWHQTAVWFVTGTNGTGYQGVTNDDAVLAAYRAWKRGPKLSSTPTEPEK